MIGVRMGTVFEIAKTATAMPLARHDRIDSWDMVDRAAPHVVGRYLLDKPRDPLFELGRSANVYERRTSITAPLYWARYGQPAQLADLFALAEQLVPDGDELVSKPVGIALKHAGTLDQDALLSFWTRMPGGCGGRRSGMPWRSCRRWCGSGTCGDRPRSRSSGVTGQGVRARCPPNRVIHDLGG
ncbi:hypothetical protein BBK82_29635 [Lentzea guizhouensis]|uniref:Uncharacterized protein n=1 Tax=Lentzea guizhouensis TaxID=1586287 RepID=A0A1B2HPH1_9PSEU|nr:DNA alkylation repair protein [Lentzea guizhouensis]ANZ39591.1 hypothetical protein BBK82_29635 [Lentzea guizhouensis]